MTGELQALNPSAADAPYARVVIVVNAFNQAHFLGEALKSCLAQTIPASEIIVVDDGSDDDPRAIVADYPGVRFLSQANRGLAAARNAGLRATVSDYVLFLDADDRLRPNAIESGLACFADNPESWMVYGAHRYIDETGAAISPIWHVGLDSEALKTLLEKGNVIAMHGAVLYRRDKLLEAGAFDESLGVFEDYDIYLRIAAGGDRIASHDEFVAEYRHHAANMSRNHATMLSVATGVIECHGRARHLPEDIRAAAAKGKRHMRHNYAPMMAKDALKGMARQGLSKRELGRLFTSARLAPFALAKSVIGRSVRETVARLPRPMGRLFGEYLYRPRKGNVAFGDLTRTRPIGAVFGFDRGTPVDRYYIESFLERHRQDIGGRVLEVGSDAYTRRFSGDAVTSVDVLHIAQTPEATIVGDLADPHTLPEVAFDCIVLTQTLHLLFDMNSAIVNLERALAPGGVLLVTVPGISPIDPGDWKDTWYWSLSERALRRLLEMQFHPDAVASETHGNVFAAISFLSGLCVEELPRAKLDVTDRSFPVVVAARAVKGAAR